MTTDPTISVIIPAFNAADYISRAVQSVLVQTRLADEIIVVDDGSTDDTYALVARFGAPVRLIAQANRGVSAARNRGLDSAHGDYVLFLDADDEILPRSLELLGRYLDEHSEADAVYSDGYFIDSSGRPIMRFSEHRAGNFTGRILDQMVLYANLIIAKSCLYRLGCLTDHGFRFDEELAIAEDWDFNIRLSQFANFGYIDKPTALYRMVGHGLTRGTAVSMRQRNLVRARYKVLHSEIFENLSNETKRAFLRDLLINYLRNRVDDQQAILESAQFAGLPPRTRADLMRWVAIEYILAGQSPEFAHELLSSARVTDPHSSKLLLLDVCARVGPRGTTSAVKLWRLFRGLRPGRDRRPYPTIPVASNQAEARARRSNAL